MESQQNLNDLKPIEKGEGIDFSEYEGVKIPIEKVTLMPVNSYYGEDGKKISEPRQVQVLKVESTIVTTLTNAEGNQTDVRASELFNLTKDKDGTLGWSKGKKAKLNNFLKKHNIDHPKKLIGKIGIIRLRRKENPDGSYQEFLGFVL